MIAEKGKLARLRSRLIFTGPTLFIFFTVMIVPFFYGIYLTFTDWDGISTRYSFVRFDNYATVMRDGVFWKSFFLTLKYLPFRLF